MGIDAGGSEFQHYSSGVYNNPNCNADKINHGVSSSSIITYMSQMMYAGQSARENVTFLSDFKRLYRTQFMC